MTLVDQVNSLTGSVATEILNTRGMIGTLASLTTDAKGSIVLAINELDAAIDAAASTGGATNLDQLTDVVVSAAATGHVLRHDGAQFVNVLGTTFYDAAGSAAAAQSAAIAASQPLSSNLTDLSGQASTAYGRSLLAETSASTLTSTLGAATTALAGISRYATTAETSALSVTSAAVTPGSLATVLGTKADVSSLATVATSGSAADLTGTLNTAQLPALAIVTVQVVADQTARLALANVQPGDVAKQTSDGTTWMLAAEPAATAGNWVELEAQGDVLSVAGRTGTVVLTKTDVGLDQVDNTSDASKPVSTAQQTALDAKQNADATLTALAGTGFAADTIAYATAPDVFTTTALTATGRDVIGAATTAAARTVLDVYSKVEIGDITTDFVATFNTALNA